MFGHTKVIFNTTVWLETVNLLCTITDTKPVSLTYTNLNNTNGESRRNPSPDLEYI